VKLSSIISLRICGPSNIPSLILACDNEENFVHKYWKHGLFLSNALTNYFIILMCGVPCIFVYDYNYPHQQMHNYFFIKHTPRLHVST
jgi:hypothetical protein